MDRESEFKASPCGISRGIGLSTIFTGRSKEFLFIGMISGLNVISDIISNSHNGESKTSFLNADFKRGCRYIWNKQILYSCPTSPLNNENAVAGWYRI